MKLTILGGGASGLMLASVLKTLKANVDIEILERYEHVGKKILMTGNGKCNLSNINITKEAYNNELGYNIASNFDAVAYFSSLGLLTVADDQGRVYPFSNVANSVLDVLRDSIEGVSIQNGCNVIRILKNGEKYKLTTDKAKVFETDMLVLATGGKTSYKDSNGYILSSMLSHRVSTLRPTLTSLKVMENLASIENLRCKVKASLFANNKVIYEDSGEVLFKKDGLSGIVIFQLSSIMARNPLNRYSVELDLMPSHTKEEIVEFISKHPSLIGLFPKMIMQYILKKANSNYPEVIANTIKHLRFNVLENMDFKNAQVTAGGVLTSEVDENLASKFNNNLYIIGELLDVDGICGGYNLHFAFASAYKVALDIINKVGVKDE